MTTLYICKVSTQTKALQNVAWVNPDVPIQTIIIDETVYPVLHDDKIPINSIAVNYILRRNHNLNIGQQVSF